MKKSRMLLLFGGLFLMLVGYVAWCGRTFYLRAPMPDLAKVPAEARTLVLLEIEAGNLRRPEKFRTKRFTELLMHPYESECQPIWIMRPYEYHIIFHRAVPGQQGFRIQLDSSEWKVIARKRDGKNISASSAVHLAAP